MPGEVKRLIDRIVSERSKGDPLVVNTTRVRLMLKGIDPERFTAETPDDLDVIQKVYSAAMDLGVRLPKRI
jgi:hypothetical protein